MSSFSPTYSSTPKKIDRTMESPYNTRSKSCRSSLTNLDDNCSNECFEIKNESKRRRLTNVNRTSNGSNIRAVNSILHSMIKKLIISSQKKDQLIKEQLSTIKYLKERLEDLQEFVRKIEDKFFEDPK